MPAKVAKRRILVIDDDKSVVDLVSTFLREAGYEVIVALDPVQGFMAAQRQLPDLLFLDVAMPAGGGIPLLKKLAASSKLRRVPVIVISALTEPSLEADVMAAGARLFLKKPLERQVIVSAVGQVLAPPAPPAK